MIGPVQYRINRGTAMKWIAALKETDWDFDPAQLSFDAAGKVYGCPEGVLARIAEPNPSVAWDGVSHLYDGEQFSISTDMKKRLKVKGSLPDFTSFNDAAESASEMLAHFAQT